MMRFSRGRSASTISSPRVRKTSKPASTRVLLARAAVGEGFGHRRGRNLCEPQAVASSAAPLRQVRATVRPCRAACVSWSSVVVCFAALRRGAGDRFEACDTAMVRGIASGEDSPQLDALARGPVWGRRGGRARDASGRRSSRGEHARHAEAASGAELRTRVLEGWALNVSRGGIRVILEDKVEPGDEFEVTLSTERPAGVTSGVEPGAEGLRRVGAGGERRRRGGHRLQGRLRSRGDPSATGMPEGG